MCLLDGNPQCMIIPWYSSCNCHNMPLIHQITWIRRFITITFSITYLQRLKAIMQKHMMQSCFIKMVICQKPMQLTLYVLEFTLTLKEVFIFIVLCINRHKYFLESKLWTTDLHKTILF